jgi:hypothetical protein
MRPEDVTPNSAIANIIGEALFFVAMPLVVC